MQMPLRESYPRDEVRIHRQALRPWGPRNPLVGRERQRLHRRADVLSDLVAVVEEWAATDGLEMSIRLLSEGSPFDS